MQEGVVSLDRTILDPKVFQALTLPPASGEVVYVSRRERKVAYSAGGCEYRRRAPCQRLGEEEGSLQGWRMEIKRKGKMEKSGWLLIQEIFALNHVQNPQGYHSIFIIPVTGVNWQCWLQKVGHAAD